MNNKQTILDETKKYVRQSLANDFSGHDWGHIHRVVQNALFIGKKENADLFIIELAALLHDVGDYKFHDGDETIGPRLAKEWLKSLNVEEQTISHICEIIENISFKGLGVSSSSNMNTLEGKVVQDADRLDAIGAVGVARTFAYGGAKGRDMYDADIPPTTHRTFDEYKNSRGTVINHFYEKLLHLKDLMNTVTARTMAEERHKFMLLFLEQFFTEVRIG